MAASITTQSDSNSSNGFTESTSAHSSTTGTSGTSLTSEEAPLSVERSVAEKPSLLSQYPPSMFEFGGDESLWNADRTRYAGTHYLTFEDIAKIPTDMDGMFEYMDDWIESNYDDKLTAEELEQRKRWADARRDEMIKNPFSIEEIQEAFGGW